MGVTAAGMTVCLLVGAGLTSYASGWLDHHEADNVRVGTFEAQVAFESYHRTQDFLGEMEEYQRRAMEAQQNQDQQTLQEIQMEVSQREQELMQHFEDDLEAASSVVADSESVSLIVSEVLYKADDVEAVDLTDELVNSINSESDDN